MERILPSTLSPETQRRYEFMLKSAHLLGKRALRMIGQGSIEMELKADGTKVTTADTDLNDQFIKLMDREFPGDLVWGEEGSNSEKGNLTEADRNWMWLIDPIDGTSGFWRSYQSRNFQECTSSVMITGFAPGEARPTLSVVHNPFHQQQSTFAASPEGTFYYTKRARGPKRLALPRIAPRSVAEVNRYEENCWQGAQHNLRVMPEMMPYARKIRTSSTGLAMGRLALGDIDIVAFPGPSNPHDVAPGALLAHRAGAVVRDLCGRDYRDIDWRVGPIEGCLGTPNEELANDFLREFRKSA